MEEAHVGSVEAKADRAVLRVLSGERLPQPPIWMMRQAGRYLPEYRALRTKAGSFLDLCYTPELAAEVTLQPIRRFGFDAAILFSDILVVPDAFGQKVWFAEGEGPRLEEIGSMADLARLHERIDLGHLAPVLETVRRVRAALPQETTLLGFCGAPFTVASYMIAGKGTPDQAPARLIAYRDPDFLQAIVDRLVEGSVSYLCAQIEAGADAVQIFESFAAALPPALFQRWSVDPIRRIAEGVRARHKGARIIVFARGAGSLASAFADGTADALGLDWGIDAHKVGDWLPPGQPVQGNLDPLALIAGGAALDEGIDRMMDGFANRPHIVNLGHGIRPETPIAHVERFVQRVRG